MNRDGDCHKNTTLVTRRYFFSEKTTSEPGPHVWGMWAKPSFRGSELKKMGKKVLELGRYYQSRTCEKCGLVDEVTV